MLEKEKCDGQFFEETAGIHSGAWNFCRFYVCVFALESVVVAATRF